MATGAVSARQTAASSYVNFKTADKEVAAKWLNRRLPQSAISDILADEPTGNLDSKTGEAVMEYLIKVVRDQGLTAAVVTHDAKIASRAERVHYMKDGLIVDEVMPAMNVDKSEIIRMLTR